MSSPDKPLSKLLYVTGIIVIFAAVYSQYFIELGRIGGFLVVYGIPVAVVSLLFGRELLRRAGKNNKTALKLGLGSFGALTVLSIFLSLIAFVILLRLNPQTLDILSRPNPVLEVPPSFAWVMVAVSILVVGPAEEYLFRGFVYGGFLSISRGRHWLLLAAVSSVLFALVHGYYMVTYGVVSVIPFITLTTFGFAMALTYYWSDGNILVPALIHGVYDATGFLGVATSMGFGLAGRIALIVVGVVFAVIYLPQKIRFWRRAPAVAQT
ncbi:MAG: lysostaphin resistance A-like protein [Candidatus Bathyarchaeia archaeon]